MSENWIIQPSDPETAQRIQTELHIHPAAAAVLAARGHVYGPELKQFLRNALNDLSLPETIPGMESCAERLQQAIHAEERIIIHGDYDVDGQTATSILVRFLRTAGINPSFLIPDRIDDGYGVSEESVSKIIEQAPDLVITVDCGINAAEQAKRIQQAGIALMITDHHLPDGNTPDTPWLVNPKLQADTPYEHLCAAGVAFNLCWATARKICSSDRVSPQYRAFLLEAILLACLGTVADIVPLKGDNRIIVARGLEMLGAVSSITGIEALKSVAGLDNAEHITTFDIGFKLGPRLNAAGRMYNATQCVTLLTSTDAQECSRIAEDLDRANRERQALCEQTTKAAINLIEQTWKPDTSFGLVAGQPDWHRGIIGIVAAKTVDRYNRPAVILAQDEKNPDIWHGSARSIGNFHITEALQQCRHLLLSCGGHQGAAGLSISTDQIDAFKEIFNQTVKESLNPDDTAAILKIDAETTPSALDISLARDIIKIGPFGETNPQPLVIVKNIQIANQPRLVGKKEQHLKLQLIAGQGRLISAIGFNMGKRLEELIDTPPLDIVFRPTVNTWQGRSSLDLHIKDFRHAD